ncbi:OmpA family protein [Aureivirga sp. CE67]|uniref:OmpA family protein n=1 Tax=Aureivirga sp. CE67 TaxID=1788983 RepID=UPI0018CAC215|nr:OmpA family protein [Aureivirga sp. CE67]
MKKILLIILSFFCSAAFYAQKGKVKKGNKKYDKLAYIDATEEYLKAVENGADSPEVYQKLGNAYFYNNKMEDAVKWYSKLLNQDNDAVDPIYYYRLSQAHKYQGNYKDSDKWMLKFAEKSPSDSRSKLFKESRDYLTTIPNKSDEIQLTNAKFNSEKSDFGTFLYKDTIYFASNRKEGEKYKWNNQPFLDLYIVDSEKNDIISFDEKLNTKLHESSIVISPNGDYAFFTRNNIIGKKEHSDSDGVNRLQLYRVRKNEDGKWGKEELLKINSDDYSVAHPTINQDGTKIYFASDMPGTVGESDIYVAKLDEEGNLEEPQNLGSLVNTEGQESFPFINEKGDLFFASNGHIGLGGFDNYVIREFEHDDSFQETLYVDNLGKPINSSKDDFAYTEYLSSNRKGFLSSNRENGKGDDDIYSFKVPKCYQIIDGIVKDKKTDQIITGANVVLDNKNNVVSSPEAISNADGTVSFKVECGTTFKVVGAKEKYTPDETEIYIPRRKKENIVTLRLSLIPEGIVEDTIVFEDKDGNEQVVQVNPKDLKVGQDLKEIFKINPIYFDFDKSTIRKDSKVELKKIIKILNKYSNLKIDVQSHTDVRGSNTYNESLSKRRNKATIAYLVNEGGINPNRIVGEGYGETRIINKCKEGVKCNDTEHEENRRSEFIILESK